MTNFDGIRCQELPSSITFSFHKVFTAGVMPGMGLMTRNGGRKVEERVLFQLGEYVYPLEF
jgi:hypothetical protein